MNIEYVIWGKSPKTNGEEALLYTKAKTRFECQKALARLKELECYDMRIQTLDMSGEGLNKLTNYFRQTY